MVIELVERLDAAASELLACLKRGEASSEEQLGVLSGTKAVRGKLDTVQALAAAGVAGSRNHGDGGAHVLAESTGVSRNDARNQVRTIKAIGAMPAVRDAVEEGRVSVANAGKLADALDKTSAGEIESDKELLAKAESLSPEQFAKEAKRWTAEREADDGEAAYRRLRARRAVRMWNGDDGMVHLYGQFDPVTGRRIRNRLNRDAHRLLDADKRHARGGAEKRSLNQCMADAFESMTRGTGGGGKPFADIALVARLDPGTEKLMAATADDDPLPASVIERLAGESSWFGLVLSAKGVPMWKGRNTRRASESQFQALMALYGGCAGCGEPDENKAHAHHRDPFACGGGTDLDNLIPLCWGCHAKIHDHHWQVVAAGDGKHTIRPPDRIHYGPAHIPDTVPLFAPSEQATDTAPRPGSGRPAGAGAGKVMAQSPVAGAGPGRQGRKQPEMRCTEPARLGMTPKLSVPEREERPTLSIPSTDRNPSSAKMVAARFVVPNQSSNDVPSDEGGCMAAKAASEAAKMVRHHTHTYATQYRERLERDHWGRTALMHDGEVIEIFDEGIEAHDAGMERFGARNFATMGIGVVSIGYRVVTPVA